MFKKIKYLTCILLIILIFINTVFAMKIEQKVYLLGDSRFVGMSEYDLNTNHKYYAKTSQGFKYLKKYYLEIKDTLTKNDFLIINFGVNDLTNKEKYVDFINEISKTNNCPIIYMTINPVDEILETQNRYTIKNIEIEEFNEYVAKNLNNNIYIIDTNKFLTSNNFETFDGLHYTENTYKEILNYLNNYLNNFSE